MARVKGRPISKKKYKVHLHTNKRSFQLTLPEMADLVPEELVSYEILDDGCILVIPERVESEHIAKSRLNDKTDKMISMKEMRKKTK